MKYFTALGGAQEESGRGAFASPSFNISQTVQRVFKQRSRLSGGALQIAVQGRTLRASVYTFGAVLLEAVQTQDQFNQVARAFAIGVVGSREKLA